MNKFWLLAYLLCFGFSNCFSLLLDPICEADHFNYSGLLINSVYLARKETRLSEVRQYAIDPYEICEEDSQVYREHKDTILDIKRQYNDLVVRIYSERFLNDDRLDDAKLKVEKDRIGEFMRKLYESQHKLERFDCIQTNFIGQMENIKNFLDGLLELFHHRFPRSDEEFISENSQPWFADMLNDVRYMRLNGDYQQNGAFVKEFDTDIFRKPLLTRPKFRFIRKSRIIYDFGSYMIRTFQVAYPFNHTRFDASKPCLKAVDLSPFYTEEQARKEIN